MKSIYNEIKNFKKLALKLKTTSYQLTTLKFNM